MKISDINIAGLDQEVDLQALYEGFNHHVGSNPVSHDLLERFDALVKENPDNTAVTEANQTISYLELDEKSNRLANWLKQTGLQEETRVGVFLDRSVDLVVSLLGILKAGGVFVPLHIDYPLERLKFILTDSGAQVLITEKRFIDQANRLQYACKELTHVMCIDSNDYYSEIETYDEEMRKELWKYIGENATDDISGGGWTNSYTNEPFTEQDMQEYAENAFNKLSPYLHKKAKVLEIGCATGLTMYKVAPYVESYYGTDLSQTIIDANKKICEERQINNIFLSCLDAERINQLGEDDFDVIIINSVIQEFSGFNYMRSILNRCIELLAPKGTVLFIGDVMDMERKDDLISDVKNYKKAHPEAKSKTDFTRELFVPPFFFHEFRYENSAIQKVHTTDKTGTIKNELSQFRYDAILEIDKEGEKADVSQKRKLQYDLRDLMKASVQLKDVRKTGPLAAIVYTSGPDGKPLGVKLSGYNLLFIGENSSLMTSKGACLCINEAADGLSLVEIFGALLKGNTLCLIPEQKLKDTDYVANVITTGQVTTAVMRSNLFEHYANENPSVFKPLHQLFIYGDPSSASVSAAVEQAPETTFLSCYGMLEHAAIFNTKQEKGGVLPVAGNLPGSGFYIMNQQLQLQPQGVSGELTVFGDGLAEGYWNREELTAERFVEDPFRDGKKLFKTGVNVRLNSGDKLEILGRKDDEKLVGGYRFNLSELEEAFLTIPQVIRHRILLTEEGQIDCAVQLTDDSDPESLKNLLKASLPQYMVPANLLEVEEFPLNESGAIDDSELLKLLDSALNGTQTHKLPQDEVQKKLLGIYQEVLGLERISIDDDFFELGGHSLLAIEVVLLIHKRLEVKVKPEDFFDNPTIEKLAPFVKGNDIQQLANIPALPEQKDYEVSYAQQRMWVSDHLEQSRLAYNMSDAFLLNGKVETAQLESAVQQLMKRHESLRTTFAEVDGEVRQIIHKEAKTGFQFIDVRKEADPVSTAEEAVKEAAQQPFDLSEGPLFRLRIWQVEDEKFILFLSMHHIISDGWSMENLTRELMLFYNSALRGETPNLKPLPVQYKEYASWQNQLLGESNEHVQFWKTCFETQLPSFQLPLDFQRPEVKSIEGKKVYFKFDKELVQRIERQNKATGATPFMTVLALLNVWIYKLTNVPDFVIGSPVAGRDHPDLKELIGLFNNTLALRNPVPVDSNFATYIKALKTRTLQAFENQVYPLDLLVDSLGLERSAGKSTLFDIGFTWQNYTKMDERAGDQFDGFQIEPFNRGAQYSKSDLWVHGWEEQGEFWFSMTYDTSLFKEETVSSWIEHFRQLSERLLENNNEETIQNLINMQRNSEEEAKREAKKKKSLQSFLTGRKQRKVSQKASGEFVSKKRLDENLGFPLVISPVIDGIILTQWLKENKQMVLDALKKEGAVLFRGFNTFEVEQFDDFSKVIGGAQMNYVDQSSPRSLVSKKIYTSTDYPADQLINMHNELSYSQDWPMQIIFFALQPSLTGGETPISDSRKVLEFISPDTRQKFREKGVMYVRNLVKGLGLSWQEVYQTDSKEEVEAYCNRHNVQFEWVSDNHLRISWVKPAVYEHPYTGEEVWFNHGFFFNSYNLNEDVKESIQNPELFPSDTFYGDGTTIEPEVIEEVKQAFDKAKVTYSWKKGDILLLDNMLIAHGRNSFEGDRKILVSMNTSYQELTKEATPVE